MTITKYTRRTPFRSPWFEVEDMNNRLNRFFGEDSGTRTVWSPTVNVQETSDELLLTAEIPGMGIEDIELDVENNVLSLSGEKREEQEEDGGRFHVRERSHGSFKRAFTLPRTVKTDKITAHVKDGILIVQMPKAPEAKSRKISIKSKD